MSKKGTTDFRKFAGQKVTLEQFFADQKSRQAKRNRAKGSSNRRRSVEYMKRMKSKYMTKEEMIQVSQEGHFGGDLFDLWDIMSFPTDVDFPIFLVQVKTNQIPDMAYMKKLIDFKVPHNVEKELHVWEDDKNEPTIIPLNLKQ